MHAAPCFCRVWGPQTLPVLTAGTQGIRGARVPREAPPRAASRGLTAKRLPFVRPGLPAIPGPAGRLVASVAAEFSRGPGRERLQEVFTGLVASRRVSSGPVNFLDLFLENILCGPEI